MIAERDCVGAGIDEFFVDRLGNAETAGGVLAVDRDEIQFPFLDQFRQALRNHFAAGPPDDVAEKENAHQTRSGWPTRRPFSVIRKSSFSSCGSVGHSATSCASQPKPTVTTFFLARRPA